MKIIDLSHTIMPGMPVYPGTEPPVFKRGTSIEKDGFIETRISMYSHTGTHIDAPSHILPGGLSLDRLPADHFIGPAVVFDATAHPGRYIEPDHLSGLAGVLEEVDFLLIKTGWSRFWGDSAYFGEFPVLSEKAARRLARFGLKGVGVDAISVDPVGSTSLPVHRILFENNIIAVENLADLDSAGGEIFIFSCMPLKIIDADGSPARAFGILHSSL